MTPSISYTFFFIATSALIIDISTYSFSQCYMPQLLLILFMHTLYEHKAQYQKYYLLLCLEIICFLRFGKIGLASLVLVPQILQFSYVKDYIFYKLLAPCLYIFIYNILWELYASYHFNHQFHLACPIVHAGITSCCFLLLEYIKAKDYA